MKTKSMSMRAMLLLLAVTVLMSTEVKADLLESEVLLLWNSYDNDSTAIRDAYIAAHPGVLELDLDFMYEDPIDDNDPQPEAVTRFLITPEAFELNFRDKISTFLESNSDVIAFVTTRGLPVLITTKFDLPPGGHFHNSNNTYVLSGVEGRLAMLGVPVPLSMSNTPANPYFDALNYPFRDFLDDTCLKGELFLVSRLDSSRELDSMGNVVRNHVQVIEDLITRSQDLTVNKYTVTFVLDNNEAMGCSFSDSESGAKYLYDRDWCVYYDTTDTFLHGANLDSGASATDCDCPDNCQLLTDELQYTDYPEIVHATIGNNHSDGNCQGAGAECVSRNYVRDYFAHPAGFFTSNDSYNGRTIRNGSDTAAHGSVLDWIAYAGGSFGAANIYGGRSFDTVQSDEVVANLYVHGMSWGESFFSSMNELGGVQLAIGDPLATVTVYDPDFDGNGQVDQTDLDRWLIYGSISNGGDINGDGVVDEDDEQIIEDAIARGILSPCPVATIPEGDFPGNPYGPGMCHYWHSLSGACRGDMNNDLVIDAADVVIISTKVGCTCPEYDIDGNGVVDSEDVQMVIDLDGTLMEEFADYNGNGIVDCDDIYEIADNYCDGDCLPGYEIYDLNCNGKVNIGDVNYALQFFDVFLTPAPNYDVTNDGVVDCEDIFEVMANYCFVDCIREYDFNCDALVDVDDAEAILLFAAPNINEPEHAFCIIVDGGGDCGALELLRSYLGEECHSSTVPWVDIECWDLNEDCIIDCTDEGLLEAYLLINNNIFEPCENYGCDDCP